MYKSLVFYLCRCMSTPGFADPGQITTHIGTVLSNHLKSPMLRSCTHKVTKKNPRSHYKPLGMPLQNQGDEPPKPNQNTPPIDVKRPLKRKTSPHWATSSSGTPSGWLRKGRSRQSVAPPCSAGPGGCSEKRGQKNEKEINLHGFGVCLEWF